MSNKNMNALDKLMRQAEEGYGWFSTTINGHLFEVFATLKFYIFKVDGEGVEESVAWKLARE